MKKRSDKVSDKRDGGGEGEKDDKSKEEQGGVKGEPERDPESAFETEGGEGGESANPNCQKLGPGCESEGF